MTNVDLSIVIVSFKVREMLAQCLLSVISNQYSASSIESSGRTLNTEHCLLNTEVFVVDNASRDGSVAMVRERFPSVRLVENVENRGFAAANNQAFVESRGRYVLMLNPDTVVRAGALGALVAFMDAPTSRRIGACGGKLLYADGSFQHSAFKFPTLAQIFFDFFPLNWRFADSRFNGRYPREWYVRGEPFQIDHPLGADLLVRREVAEQVGWLDKDFFIYCEEIDWCLRIKRAGWQIWCVPRAEIVHHEAQSTRQFRHDMFVELWRARFRLFDKHYSRAFRWAARWIVRAGLWNAARKTRVAAQLGSVTQDELARRLAAYRQVAELGRGSTRTNTERFQAPNR